MNDVIEIDYAPHVYQQEFHYDTERFKIVAGGRRSGKSFSCLQDLIAHCLSTPKALAWWVSPTYRDAREIGFSTFMDYYDTILPAIKKIYHSSMRVVFLNGAELFFKGSDNPDSLRGRGLTKVGIDEAAFCKEELWYKILRPALSDRHGHGILCSTPNGKNWFYELYRKARSPAIKAHRPNSWKHYFWPTEINPLIPELELEEAREGLSSTDYRQEYLAEFITKAGLIYDDFNDDNVTDDFVVDPQTQSFYIGADFGYANPSAFCFMAVEHGTQKVTQFDEIYQERTTIEQLHHKMLEKLAYHGLHQDLIKYVYTDPAGNADELSSGISPVDHLRSKGWKVVNKGSNVAPGLALVRAYVLNAAGQRRYIVHSRCKNTIRSFNGYSYKMTGLVHKKVLEDPDKDNKNDHACDAVRYFFVNKFDHAKYVFSELDQQPFLANTQRTRIIKKCGKCRRPFPSTTPKTQPPYLCKECLDA